MDANTQYTLSFDGAIRDQGQFGGGANIISNLGSFDLKAIAVGSTDGTLAQQDFAPSFASTGAWQNFSLSWDSTDVAPLFTSVNTGCPSCGEHRRYRPPVRHG